jgi:hypothetical protein
MSNQGCFAKPSGGRDVGVSAVKPSIESFYLLGSRDELAAGGGDVELGLQEWFSHVGIILEMEGWG